MADQIKRVNRELIHKGAIIDYYVDKMEFPNGNTENWDFIHNKGAAAVVPVLPDGRIVMVRQYRNALERETLEIPAGKLDFAGESGMSCSARELEEETGYKCGRIEPLITLCTTVAFCDEKIEIYLATDLNKTAQHLDENEMVEIESYTLDELKTKIFNMEIQDSKTIAAILAYNAKVK